MSDVKKLALAIIAACQPFAEGEAVTEDSNVVELKQKALDAVTEATSTEPRVWGLCAAKDFYIPWNEEIHAATKRINADGTFMKFRGLKPDTFTQKECAWIDKHGLEAEFYELIDGQPVSVDNDKNTETETITTSRPSSPVRPNSPAKPGKPGKPGAPARPNSPAKPEVNPRKEALSYVNTLSKDYSVEYDFIVEQLLPEGVESFDELTEDEIPTLTTEAKAWVDWLKMITEVKEKITEIDQHGDELINSNFNYYVNEASTNGELNGVPREELGGLHTKVEETLKEWTNFYKDEGMM